MAERVLLLDAELRQSLAVVRSLGRRGVPVLAASAQRGFPVAYSRYAAGRLKVSSEASAQTLVDIIERERISVMVAGGLTGNELICRHRAELEPLVRAPFNDLVRFQQLADKRQTVQLAASLDVPVPETVELRSTDDARSVASQLGFPVVVKSPLGQGTVRYARNVHELQRIVDGGGAASLIAQRYIDGDGHGFYGLADHGRLQAYFMHRRLHEVPPTGGASAMAMSYRDPALAELGERFFSATRWHGVAMVEFKRNHRDGRYYLIEVNPKFWGSLDLSIAAGVDFPYLLYELIRGRTLHVMPGSYRDETIFRWLTMDLAYAAATHQPMRYLRAFADRRISDDLDRTDPLPTVILFATGVGRVFGPDADRIVGNDTRTDTSLALRTFYRVKPLIPRRAQVAVRRLRARRIWNHLGRESCKAIPKQPLSYTWPDEAQACALLTHDIETANGQRNIPLLTDLERERGLRSCWNFVVRRYDVDRDLIGELRSQGDEIGVHGVYHDGREFASAEVFRERLEVMRRAAAAWGASGFRSPSLLYDPCLLRELPFAWDSSMPAWDPFQPKPGDCKCFVPFALSEICIELPVTIWQDFTLFEELQMDDIAVWRSQIDAVYAAGGLINMIVHPDYMVGVRRLGHYEALLDHLVGKDGLWITTPSQVAEWERSRRRYAGRE